MVEDRWAGFDITGKKKADSGKVTPDSTREEKDAAFQKVIDYAESLGITFKGHAPNSVPTMQENCVVYTLDELGCMAQGIDTKGAVTSTETNSELEELKKQLKEKDEIIQDLTEKLAVAEKDDFRTLIRSILLDDF